MGSLRDAYLKQKVVDKLKTGQFKDTGQLYSPEQARQDATNPELRMVLYYDADGQPRWRREAR